jgi:HSP20 family molecular chaperone IbpA
MQKRIKGIHDITTSLHRARIPENREAPKAKKLTISLGSVRDSRKRYFKKDKENINAPRVWAFSTKPRFRRYEKQVNRTLFVERIEEPKIDIFERMDNVVILAELPEMKKENIQWEINGDIFSFCAQDKLCSKKYVKEVLLPFIVDEETIRKSYKDGIFEVILQRKQKEKVK